MIKLNFNQGGYKSFIIIILHLACFAARSAPCNTTYISGTNRFTLRTDGTGAEHYIATIGTNHVWYLNNTPVDDFYNNVYSAATLDQNGSSCTIRLDMNSQRQLTNCVLKLTVTYDNGGPTREADCIEILILPYLNIPSSYYLYPGETVTFGLVDKCNNGNNTAVSCVYTHNWNVSPGDCCQPSPAGCNLSGASVNVQVPISPAHVPLTVTLNDIISCWPGINSAISTAIIPVSLRSPFINIGPASVGCLGDPPSTGGSLTFGCTSVLGAGYYQWSVFLNGTLQPIIGQGTRNITVSPSQTGLMDVRVYALTAYGSQISSLSVNKYCNICCIPTVTITNNVVAPNTDNQQAALGIEALNSIDNGARAIYHGGAEVKLSQGFSAAPGSFLHAYIATCSSGYYRIANSDTNSVSVDYEAQPASIQPAFSNISNFKDIGNTDVDIRVIPNPTSGHFKITMVNAYESPTEVSITDVFGNTVYDTGSPKAYNFDVDITKLPAGIYIVKLVYSGKNYFKKIIKN